MGTTQVGPQRADLTIRLDGLPVKDRISRGQQKLLAAALLIAQLRLFPQGSLRPTLLLDDPAAELDNDRLVGLIHELSRQAVQMVVTSLSPAFDTLGTPGRRYRIDSGRVTPADG
jgi:DNA replication and repair protein RecF